jgi:hypothetical protein
LDVPAKVIIAAFLNVLVGMVLAAQDRFTLKVNGYKAMPAYGPVFLRWNLEDTRGARAEFLGPGVRAFVFTFG